MCLYTRKIKGRHGCMCVSVIITLPSTASCVCICMLTHTDTLRHTHRQTPTHAHRPHNYSRARIGVCTGNLLKDDTHIHTPISVLSIDCLYRHIFILHVYRSVSFARMRRYTQLAYLFHQCPTSLLSRDGRIADCAVRHPGVQRPFSSLI